MGVRWLARALSTAFALCITLAAPRAAHGQAREHAPQTPRVSLRTPPRIEYLPELELPEDLEVPEAALEVVVRVEIDGRASLEEASAQGELRARIEQAIEQARFAPARINDEPVSARVRLRFALRRPQVEQPEVVRGESAMPKAALQDLDRDQLGARAEVDPPRPAARKLALAEMRDVPGAFGDPFRVLDTLPGVVPLFSGLPYVFVRGAPPAGTIYVYDGITMPALFHLALGPAVIHPTMIGDLQFYAAVPPARYGRRTGGVFAAEGKKPDPSKGVQGEAELRLLDVSGMVDAPLDAGDKRHRLQVAGRYGYPGLLLSIFAEDAVLAYWDYQLRYSVPLSKSDRVELTWFGSYDYVGEADDPDDDDNFALEFHRAELRVLRERPDFELGFALQGGYEESSLGDEVGVYAWRLGPRTWAAVKLSDDVRMRVGMDMLAALGAIDGDRGGPPVEPPSQTAPPTANALALPVPGDPAQRVGLAEDDDFSPFDNPVFADVSGRNLAGVYAELEVDVTDQLTVAPGLRADAWLTGALLTGAHVQNALEPRLITSYQLTPEWRVHAGAGLGHQVAALPIALPGFNDVALERGLQRSISTEAGVAFAPLPELRFESTIFYNHLSGLLLPDLFVMCSDDNDEAFCEGDDIPRGEVDAYGIELFAKRDASKALSGWLSYTLGWADGKAGNGYAFTPSFDVRHVGNLVVQWRIGAGFSVGGRVHYRTGKTASDRAELLITEAGGAQTPYISNIERRLPAFFRADAQLIYAWSNSWSRMRISLEWMNLTLSKEAIDLNCTDDYFGGITSPADVKCEIDYAPAIFFPNLGIRAEL